MVIRTSGRRAISEKNSSRTNLAQRQKKRKFPTDHSSGSGGSSKLGNKIVEIRRYMSELISKKADLNYSNIKKLAEYLNENAHLIDYKLSPAQRIENTKKNSAFIHYFVLEAYSKIAPQSVHELDVIKRFLKHKEHDNGLPWQGHNMEKVLLLPKDINAIKQLILECNSSGPKTIKVIDHILAKLETVERMIETDNANVQAMHTASQGLSTLVSMLIETKKAIEHNK